MSAAGPAFYIEVVQGTHLGTPVPRISWTCPGGFLFPMQKRMAMRGRYACHKVADIGVHMPLIEPSVEISVTSADAILRGIETGYIDNDAVVALRAALAKAMRSAK